MKERYLITGEKMKTNHWARSDRNLATARRLPTYCLFFVGYVTLLFLFLVSVSKSAEVQTVPKFLDSEESIRKWVEKTVMDAPPAGGIVKMLMHREPKYANNDRVGEIWIVSALCNVTIDGKMDHEMLFLVYHCDNHTSEVKIGFGVSDADLPAWLNMDKKESKKSESISI